MEATEVRAQKAATQARLDFNQSCPYELSYYIFLVTSLGKQTKKTPMS